MTIPDIRSLEYIYIYRYKHLLNICWVISSDTSPTNLALPRRNALFTTGLPAWCLGGLEETSSVPLAPTKMYGFTGVLKWGKNVCLLSYQILEAGGSGSNFEVFQSEKIPSQPLFGYLLTGSLNGTHFEGIKVDANIWWFWGIKPT